MYQELVLHLNGVRSAHNAKAANLSAKCIPPRNPRMRLNAGFCRRYKPPEHPNPCREIEGQLPACLTTSHLAAFMLSMLGK